MVRSGSWLSGQKHLAIQAWQLEFRFQNPHKKPALVECICTSSVTVVSQGITWEACCSVCRWWSQKTLFKELENDSAVRSTCLCRGLRFPAPTWQFTTTCHSNSRRSDSIFSPSRAQYKWVAQKYIHSEQSYIKLKQINPFFFLKSSL